MHKNKKTIYFSGIIFGLLIGFFGFSQQVLADADCCYYQYQGKGLKCDVMNGYCPKDLLLEYDKTNCKTYKDKEGTIVQCPSAIVASEKVSCMASGYQLCKDALLFQIISGKVNISNSGEEKKELVLGTNETISFIFKVESYGGDTSLSNTSLNISCVGCPDGVSWNKSNEIYLQPGSYTSVLVTLDSAKYFKNSISALPYDLNLEFKLDILGYKLNSKKITFTIKQFDCSANKGQACKDANNKFCFPLPPDKKCVSRLDPNLCSQLTNYPTLCGPQEDGTNPGSKVCYWNKQLNQCQTALGKGISEQYAPPPGYKESGGIIPPCAFAGQCRRVNDLLETVIRFGKSFFAVIGSIAFVFFVYGGLTMILSFGNAEKTKKGRDILVAAVIGLIIVFSAYLLINFVLDAIGVESTFRGIGQ